MSRNAEVAALLEEYAALLEAQDVGYKPRAYRLAAESIRDYPEPIEELVAEGQDAVERIDRVGDSIAAKVIEYFETGQIERLEEVRADLPVDIQALTRVQGVGPKTIGDLYRELGVQTLDDLEQAAREEKIREVSGFGAKTEENILAKVEFAREAEERELLGDVRPLADDVLAYFEDVSAVERSEVAGSLRRWRATVGDIDVLVGAKEREAVIDAFTDWPRADEVIEAGTNKASIQVRGLRVDLRVVVPEEFGSALHHFTGSKAHNIHLRNYAIERDQKINEYGVFDVSGIDDPDAGQRVGERIAGDTEESVFEVLDLPWIPPEMREDRGEIEAAVDDALPDLLDETDVGGEFHVHTEYSDGGHTIAEMVDAAAELGYEFVGISDHATGPGIVSGLSDAELLEQIEAVHAVDEERDIDVFAGVEANIDADGGITTGDDVLSELDFVVASIHNSMNMDAEATTERLVTAIEHPSVDVIGHPSTRLINRRPSMDFDTHEVASAAAEHDTALEINANPARLDLWGGAVKIAIEEGARIAINTDAHSPSEYANMRYGVHTARRGWAAEADVVNCLSADDLREFFH